MSAPARARGSAMLEFTLAGIPLLFVIVSTFEMARGMWLYHSLAYAAKAAARYAVVHGRGCTEQGNACAVAVSDVAHRVARAATGLPPESFDVRLISHAGTVPCAPLSACFGNAASWPPEGANAPGLDIRVEARHEFRSALSLFWPGAGSVRMGAVTFAADARQRIEF